MASTPVTTVWRTRALAILLGLTVLLAPGCARLTRHFSGHSSTRKGSLTVTPPSGSPGTAFSLSAGGFRAGEAMTFEIDLPNRTRFVGPSHTAGPDGTVSSTYTPLTGDPGGTYRVHAVGNRGTRADGTIVVSGGASSSPTPSSTPGSTPGSTP